MPGTARKPTRKDALTDIALLFDQSARRIRGMMEEALASLRIPFKHFGVISAIRRMGPVTQHDAAEMLNIDRTTMVWLVDELEKKGIVTRRAHPSDRRCHRLCLNPSGQKVLLDVVRRVEEAEREFLAPLTAAEREDLRRILLRLLKRTAPGEVRTDGFSGGGKTSVRKEMDNEETHNGYPPRRHAV